MGKGALKVNIDAAHAILDGCREGDQIEIHFADASKNYNVKSLTNTVVACHKRVTGRFIALVHEKAYGTEYLLMQSWDTSWHTRVVWSIPVAVIVHVQHIEKKSKKVTSDVGQVYLGGGARKTIEQEGGIGEPIG